MLPMTTVAGVPPFYSGGTHAEPLIHVPFCPDKVISRVFGQFCPIPIISDCMALWRRPSMSEAMLSDYTVSYRLWA